MSSDSIATIDLSAASAPRPPPEDVLPQEPVAPPPREPPRWLGAVGRLGAVLGCFALAALLQWRGLDWAASSASWLEGVPRPGGLPEVGAIAVLWRKTTTHGLSLGHAASLWQLFAGGGLLAALVLVAWQLRGLAAAITALALFLLWPTSRGLLSTVGAEAPLAAALLFVALAGLVAWARPLVSALLLGGSIAALVLVHPLGLPLAIVATLAVLILPLRRGVEPLPGIEPHEGLWPHAVTVPNLAGLLFGAGLLAAAHGTGGLKIVWMRYMADWRAPVVTPWMGGLADWPVLGPIVALAAQSSLPILVLAISAGVGAVRRPTDPVALPVALTFGSWLAIAWIGLPTIGFADAATLLAPGAVLLAAVMVVDVARELWARGTTGARSGGVVLAIALLLAFFADQRLAVPDRRNLLGHLPGVMASSTGVQPAVLRPADLGLLYRKPTSTTILPAHLGGNPLAMALRQLHPPLQGLNFGAAFSTELVLVATMPSGTVEDLWAHIGKQEACSADGKTCLIRIRGK